MKEQATATKRAHIVELFESLDEPVSIKELTAICVKDKVWSKEDYDRAVFRSFEAEVRTALNDMDVQGCPVSLVRHLEIERDPDGNPIKVELRVQKEFWTEADAQTWIRRRAQQLREDYAKLEKFIDYCVTVWPKTNWWGIAGVRLEDRQQ